MSTLRHNSGTSSHGGLKVVISVDQRTEAVCLPQVDIHTPWGRRLQVDVEGMTPDQIDEAAADLLSVAGDLMAAAGKLRRLSRERTDDILANMVEPTK